MHYIVIATESDETESWSVQRTFTSDTELTKDELERMFLVAHWKEFAELGESEPTDNWTEDDCQTFFEENGGNIYVDHVYHTKLPIYLEEVAE